MQNISVTDVVIASNRGAGISVGLKHLQCEKPSCRLKPDCMCPLNPPSVTITVDGAVIEGAARLPGLNDSATRKNVGIKLYAGGKPGGSRGFVSFSNVAVSDTVQPGLAVENKAANRMPTIFSNCTWSRTATAKVSRWADDKEVSQNVPLMLHQTEVGTIGGITFRSCNVDDSRPSLPSRPWLECDSCDSRGSATAIGGTVSVSNGEGCEARLGKTTTNVTLKVQCKSDDDDVKRLTFRVFTHGDGGVRCWRIPGLVAASDWLLAFAEARNYSDQVGPWRPPNHTGWASECNLIPPDPYGPWTLGASKRRVASCSGDPDCSGWIGARRSSDGGR